MNYPLRDKLLTPDPAHMNTRTYVVVCCFEYIAVLMHQPPPTVGLQTAQTREINKYPTDLS